MWPVLLASELTRNRRIKKNVVTLTHEEASRKNIPTAEYQSVMRTDEQSPSGSRMNGATTISTRNWCGAAKMSRTGAT
jgi:adenine-specific DNA-methyltransferase